MIEILNKHIRNIKNLLAYDTEIFNAVMTLLAEFQERSYCLDLSQKETINTINDLKDLLNEPKIKNNNNSAIIYSEYNRVIKIIFEKQSPDYHRAESYLLKSENTASTSESQDANNNNKESLFSKLQEKSKKNNIKAIIEKLSQSKINGFVVSSTVKYKNNINCIRENINQIRKTKNVKTGTNAGGDSHLPKSKNINIFFISGIFFALLTLLLCCFL